MLTFSISYFLEVLPKLFTAIPMTVEVIGVSTVLCLLSGIIVSVVRIRRTPVFFQITEVWLSFVRSMPFVLLLFLSYFLTPFILTKTGIITGSVNKIVYVYITMVIAYAPVLAEVIRPAYFSIDKGQEEAAVIFGMNSFQWITQVVFPQMVPTVLPLIVNQIIEIVKDTSLMYMIGLMDLMGRAELLITVNQGLGKLESYLAVAVLYWIIIGILETVLKRLENRQTRILNRRES